MTEDSQDRYYNIDVVRLQWNDARRTRLEAGIRQQGASEFLAENVLNPLQGPIWVPGGADNPVRLLYVENDPNRGYPIALADFDAWSAGRVDFRSIISEEFGTVNHYHLDLIPYGSSFGFAFTSQEGDVMALRIYGLRRRAEASPSKGLGLLPSILLPGIGQISKGSLSRGALYAAGALAAGALASLSMVRYNDASGTLEDKYALYVAEVGELGSELTNHRNQNDEIVVGLDSYDEAVEAFEEADTWYSRRQMATIAVIGIYAANLADVLLSSRVGNRSFAAQGSHRRVTIMPGMGGTHSDILVSAKIRF
jgi:hypothetical protein